MITTLFYYTLSGVIAALIAILPDAAALNSNIGGAISTLNGAISLLGWLLPFDTLFEVLGAAITVEVAIFTYKIVNWFIKKIRGSG